MKSPKAIRRVIETLAEQHPNADTELHYRNAYELLVATMLSAQSTDARVNIVTPALFERYPDATTLASTTTAELEPQIISTGFFRQKSKALLAMAQALVRDHSGQVPADMNALTKLAGVGRKTANVVLGHALGVPGLPVDRHVLRVANRIGIAESDDPEKVEAQLCIALPKEMWTLASDVQILHGRRICRPRPLCDQCFVSDECDFYTRDAGLGARDSALVGRDTKPKRRGAKASTSPKRRAPKPRSGSRAPSPGPRPAKKKK